MAVVTKNRNVFNCPLGELKSTAVAAIFGFPIDTMYIL
jgi:hypothetical protein